MNRKNTILYQTLLGVAGLLATIGIFVFYVNTFKFTNQWYDFIFMIVMFGCFVGSVMCLIGSMSMFFYGFMVGVGIGSFIVLSRKLPGIWTGVFMVACAAAFVAWPRVKDYLIDRERNSAEPKIKKLAQKIKEEEELIEAINKSNQEFLSSIDFGRKSLLLRYLWTGDFYQCIKGEDKLYFIYVGRRSSGVDEELVKKNFSDENTYVTGKKDFAVKKSDILSIKYKTDRLPNSNLDNSGSFVLECRGKKKRYEVVAEVSLETVREFFHGIKVDVKSKKKKDKENKEVEGFIENNVKVPRDKNLVAKLKLIVTILTVVSILASATFLFLPLNYRVMSIICMLLFIVIFALYIKYNDVISLSDKKGATDFTKGKVKVTFAIMAPGFGLGLRSLLDFTFADFKMFWIWTTVLAVLILFVFFKFTEEYKKDKSAILVIVLVVLFYAPSAVAQTNTIFDFSKSRLTKSTVQHMRISEDSKSGDRYLVETAISNGKIMEIEVSEEYYKELSVGDKITILEKPGFLKIPHVYVKER